jgi:hypothetical protein
VGPEHGAIGCGGSVGVAGLVGFLIQKFGSVSVAFTDPNF